MRRRAYILLLLCVAALASCKRFPDLFTDKQLLAEANGKFLYLYDIEAVFTPGISPEDSVKLLETYVDQWVKKQLKIGEAERIFHSSEDDIEKMVADYRASLLMYRIDQFYVDNRIDTVFTDAQLNAYYDANKSDYILDRAIIKGRVVRIPNGYRQSTQLKTLMNSPHNSDYQDFVDICIKNGFELTEFNSWNDYSELLSMIPDGGNTDYDIMLVENKLFEFSDKSSTLLVKITDRRRAGDPQPLENVVGTIRRVMLNDRSQEIVRRYEDSLYNDAVANRKIKIKQ